MAATSFFGGAFFGGEFFNTPSPAGGPTDLPSIVQPTPPGGMVGGIGRWTIQIPQPPKKKEYIFKRNMEARDRTDIEDILNLLMKSGLL